jgi:hypothetical protein
MVILLVLTYCCRDYIARLDGVTHIPGGWLNGHWVQLGYQLASSVSGFVYSFGATCIILFVLNLIPGLRLRATEEQEILGIDDTEIGEFAVRSAYRLTGVKKKLSRSWLTLVSTVRFRRADARGDPGRSGDGIPLLCR